MEAIVRDNSPCGSTSEGGPSRWRASTADGPEEPYEALIGVLNNPRSISSAGSWTIRPMPPTWSRRCFWGLSERRGPSRRKHTQDLDLPHRGKPGGPLPQVVRLALAPEGQSPANSAPRRPSAVNPKFRAPLLLREIEGLSYQEISEILNVSPATVKSRIQQGRDA